MSVNMHAKRSCFLRADQIPKRRSSRNLRFFLCLNQLFTEVF